MGLSSLAQDLPLDHYATLSIVLFHTYHMVLSSFRHCYYITVLIEMSETPWDKGCSFGWSREGLCFAFRCARPSNLGNISMFRILGALTFAMFQDKVGIQGWRNGCEILLFIQCSLLYFLLSLLLTSQGPNEDCITLASYVSSCSDYRSKEHGTWLRMGIWLLQLCRLCLHVLAGHSSIGKKTADVLNESAMPQCQTPFSIINDDLPDGTTSHALLLIRRRACSFHDTSDVNVCPVQSCWWFVFWLSTLRKRLQEHSSSDATSRTSTSLITIQHKVRDIKHITYILEIGVGAMYLNKVVIIEWHTPKSVVFSLPRSAKVLPKFIRGLLEYH